MKVYCPDCGAQIAAEDLNLDKLLARCRACNSFFSFADAARAETGAGIARVAGREIASTIPRPPRIQVEDTGQDWIAKWRWFSPAVVFLIFFCIAWDAFLIFWYSMALTKHAPWIMVIFPVAHVAVGVSLTYFTLATLMNTTTVRANRNEVSVQSGPLPWFGNRQLQSAAVKQLFSRTINSSGNSPGFNHTNGNISFGVFAVLADGRTIRLIGGLKDTTEAAFLQQQLENRLQIRPSPLPAQV